MPLYEYICHACQHEFEIIQKFSDPPIKKCPECHKPKVKKKVSLSAFALKGEGWYKDGYARPSEKPKTEASQTSENKSPPSDTKSDAKAKDVTTPAAAKSSTKTTKESKGTSTP